MCTQMRLLQHGVRNRNGAHPRVRTLQPRGGAGVPWSQGYARVTLGLTASVLSQSTHSKRRLLHRAMQLVAVRDGACPAVRCTQVQDEGMRKAGAHGGALALFR